MKIVHSCDTSILKQVARDTLEYYQQHSNGTSITHESAAGIEIVTVTWMKSKFSVVLGFHPGVVMVAVKAPASFRLFRSVIQGRVRSEVEQVLERAGGALVSMTDSAGNEV
jgi:sRNA-binding carbon storage regulator CsrA